MAIPISSTFTLFDWNSAGVSIADGTHGLLQYASTSRGSPYISAGSGVVRLQSPDGIQSRVTLPIGVPPVYTLEFRVRLDLLPADFSLPTHRHVFLGVLNPSGGAAGILLARDGIAVVGDPKAEIAPLSGSSGLTVLGEYVVVRVTVDTQTKLAFLYVTADSSLATTGHVLRHTIRLPKSSSQYGDAMVIEVVGEGPDMGDISLSSLRLGEGTLTPNKRPVAVLTQEVTARLGEFVMLDGTGSYDPDGTDLTYYWTTTETPTGATVVLSGVARAAVTHGGVAFSAVANGSAGQGLRVDITDPGMSPSNNTLDLSVDGDGIIQVVLRHESSGVTGRTTDDELVSAIMNPTDPSYSTEVAALLSAELTGAAGVITAAGELTLVGGADSTYPQPVFHAAMAGRYQFSLAVSDGELTSTTVYSAVVVLESFVEVGRVPDGSVVWSYLPDVMSLIAGRERLETFWSSLIQLVGAELLRLKQVDYAKSLVDIGETIAHKWVSFPVLYTPTGQYRYREDSRATLATPLDDEDGDLTTRSLLVQGALPDDVVQGDAFTSYQLGTPVALLVSNWYPLRLRSTQGRVTAGSNILTVLDGGVSAAGVQDGDPVVIFVDGSPVSFRARRRLSDTTIELKETSLVTITPPAVGVVQVGGVMVVTEDVIPSFLEIDAGTLDGTAVDDSAGPASTTTWFELLYGSFSDDIVAGDYLRIGGVDYEITAATGTRLTISTSALDMMLVQGVSWQVVRDITATAFNIRTGPHLLATEDLDTVYASDRVVVTTAEEGETEGWVESCSGNRLCLRVFAGDSTAEVVIHRLTALPARESTRSVPVLQTHSGASAVKLSQAVDYAVGTEELEFLRSSVTLSVTGDSGVATVTGADVVAGQYLWIAGSVGANSGLYRVLAVDGDELTLNQPFAVTAGSVTASLISLNHDTLPEQWWAEYVYESNHEAIESGFGVLVGLTYEDYSAISSGSYLAAVTALHLALWSGPKVSSIQLGGQVFFNLPFSLKAGTIQEVNAEYSTTHGQILISDADDPLMYRAYYYPLTVGVATNPDTNTAYTVGDSVRAFAPLSNGVLVKDYINSPNWWKGYLPGAQQLRKFHTFKVEVDLDGVDDTGPFALTVDFLDRAKPKYTDYLLVGVRAVSDAISVTSRLAMTAKLMAKETLYITPDGALLSGAVQAVTSSTVELESTASSVDDVYNGLFLYLKADSTGGQMVEITDYDGTTKVATVDAAPIGMGDPSDNPAYQVVNPPPFHYGAHPSLDYYDGRGSYDPSTGRMYWPCWGEPPTAIVVLASSASVFFPRERVNVGGRFVGKVKNTAGSTMYLDIVGGSLPQAGDTLVGRDSGASVAVTAATLGQWPDYAYVNRHRSEVWIPLDSDTILGPVAEDDVLAAYTAGDPSVTLGASASSVNDTYVNWKVVVGGQVRRILSYDGGTKKATVATVFSPALTGNEAYDLHPPKPICVLRDLDFFEQGSLVRGVTSGHTARVKFFGPSYLRLVDTSHNPYSSFIRGEELVGEDGETATALDEPFYITPDFLSALDRRDLVGPASAVSYRLCFRIGADGHDPTLDHGLIMDDVELFQRPYDSDLTIAEQYVPSHGPGLYWWAGSKLTYNHVDANPAGPGPEPLWVASPSVPSGTLSTDPGWNDNVLHDIVICRVVSTAEGTPPEGSPIPDPIVLAVA